MAGKYKPTKGFNYEDDHDYDDAIDYAAQGMVYWYGKYYKKETIDKMFEDQEKGSGLIGKPLLALVGVLGLWGICEVGSTYLTHRAYDKRQKRKQKQRTKQKTSSSQRLKVFSFLIPTHL